MASCAALGVAQNEDFNGEHQEGYGLHDFTIYGGRRQSSSTAFLTGAKGRSNLIVMSRALATRIVIDKRARARTVEFTADGGAAVARARREIVLCGGAINSPQLLMLSGIGEASALRQHGIPVQTDLPGVGANLQDHLGAYVATECTQPITLRRELRYDRAAFSVVRALFLGSGPATAIPISACAFLRTNDDLEIPDVQITLIPGLVVQNPWRRPERHGFILNAYQLRPSSRGSVTLRSQKPTDKPVIRGGYLTDRNDIETLREGVRLVRRIAAQEPFADVRDSEIAPGSDVQSNTDLDHWIRSTATTFFHPVGTCRMGIDPFAVVDPELRVRGITGLRVADASVMPTIVGGNTNAATVMIAEKAADLIRGRTLPADRHRRRMSASQIIGRLVEKEPGVPVPSPMRYR